MSNKKSKEMAVMDVLSLLDCPWIMFDDKGSVLGRDTTPLYCPMVFKSMAEKNIFDNLGCILPDYASSIIESVINRADPNANHAIRLDNGGFFTLTVKRVHYETFIMILKPSTEVDYMDSVSRANNWIDSRGVISLFLIDYERKIATWNISARSMFLYSKKEIIGQDIRTLLDEKSVSILSDAMYLCKTRGWYEADVVLQRKNASPFNARIILSRQRDSNYIAVAATDLSWMTAIDNRIHKIAGSDDLTGAINRRYFLDILEKETLRVRRYGGTLSLIMVDIDYFKTINDTYGHDAGDQVLKRLVHELSDTVRKVDIISRLGGEEFAILLPSTNLIGALSSAERIREIIENCRVEYEGKIISFTASIGVAETKENDRAPSDLMRAADKALYKSKNNGRNQVSANTDDIE